MSVPNARQLSVPNAHNASRIAVDQTGQFAAVCSSAELCVFALEAPKQSHCLRLNLGSDPAGLKWHPNDSSQLSVVRFNRCELLLWDATECRLRCSANLSGYVRPITSLDWSPLHPYLLVTSSADQFRAICVWDLRDLSRPVRAVESLSDPSVVKWNLVDNHVFASAHRSTIRLWDLRNNLSEPYSADRPYNSRTSHSLITDLDWSPANATELVTVDRDGWLSTWDTHYPGGVKQQVHANRASLTKVTYTPSGQQILTLPNSSKWSTCGLMLWNVRNLCQAASSTIWRDEDSLGNVVQPYSSDPVVRDICWRKANSQGVSKEHEDEFFKTDNLDVTIIVDPTIELVALCADNVLRFYPIKFQGTPLLSSRDASGASVPGQTKMPASTFTSPALSNVAPVDQTVLNFRRAQATPGKQKPKVNDSATAPLLVGAQARARVAPDSDVMGHARQLLSQELSSLSPETGQYKVEEIDLINRYARFKIYYHRKQHGNQLRPSPVRLPSNEFEDSDGLLQSASATPSTAETPTPYSAKNDQSCIPVEGTITVHAVFPLTYPASSPVFTIPCHEPALPQKVVSFLLEVLHSTAAESISSSNCCVELCLQKTVKTLQSISSWWPLDEGQTENRIPYPLDTLSLHSEVDSFSAAKTNLLSDENRTRTPFPRTSGVCFTPTGHLLAFGLPVSLSAIWNSVSPEAVRNWTPRSYLDFCQMRLQLFGTPNNMMKGTPDGSPCITTPSRPGSSSRRIVESEQDRTPRNLDNLDSQNTIFDFSTDDITLPVTRSTTAMGNTDTSTTMLLPGTIPAELLDTYSQSLRSAVQVYDFSDWFVSRDLILSYSMDTGNIHEMCSHNYLIALGSGRKDLVQFWDLTVVLSASLASFPKGRGGNLCSLPISAVGKALMYDWLHYFCRTMDFQHLGMCVLVLFSLDALYREQLPSFINEHCRSSMASGALVGAPSTSQNLNGELTSSKASVNSVVSFGLPPSMDDPNGPNASPQRISVSFNLDESGDLPSFVENTDTRSVQRSSLDACAPLHSPHTYSPLRCPFVSAEDIPSLAHYVSAYASMLYAMGMFLHHARLLRSWAFGLIQKRIIPSSKSTALDSGISVDSISFQFHVCSSCRGNLNSVPVQQSAALKCTSCLSKETEDNGADNSSESKQPPFLECSICRLPTKGLVFLCPGCSHGGHLDHLFRWFKTHESSFKHCPVVDCACVCIK